MDRTFKPGSLKRFFLGTIIIVMLLISGIFCLMYLRHNIIDTEAARSKADSIAVFVTHTLEEENFADTNGLFGELKALALEAEGIRISIYTRSAGGYAMLFTSHPAADGETALTAEEISRIGKAYETVLPCRADRFQEITGIGRAVSAFYPIAPDGQVRAVVRIDAAAQASAYGGRHLLYGVLLLVLLILLILPYCIYVFRVIIRPLARVQEMAESVAVHDDLFLAADTGENMIDKVALAIDRIRDKQERLDESLSYAREIQVRMLTAQEEFAKTFADYAIFWKPLALVSGDFYWLRSFPSGTVLICGDCTGHGIPGALMTMMIISLLEHIVNEDTCSDTAYLLWKMDEQLAAILNSSHAAPEKSGIKDGLDAVILFIDRNKNISISSTNMKVFKVKPLNTVEVINGQRFFIGDGKIDGAKNVRTVNMRYEEKTCWFMASDGLFEQVGGARGIPYGYSRFKKIIHRESAGKMQKCINEVTADFISYMGNEIQRDDVTIIGFRP